MEIDSPHGCLPEVEQARLDDAVGMEEDEQAGNAGLAEHNCKVEPDSTLFPVSSLARCLGKRKLIA